MALFIVHEIQQNLQATIWIVWLFLLTYVFFLKIPMFSQSVFDHYYMGAIRFLMERFKTHECPLCNLGKKDY